MNIQDLETKYKELGAEIERLKQQARDVWEPSLGGVFWMVDWGGGVRSLNPNNRAAVSHHNVYKTEALAKKASVLQRRSNLVIQACLNFDPHFIPAWSDGSGLKYGFHYSNNMQAWHYSTPFLNDDSVAYVSTSEIAYKVMEYLNSQRIK